MLKERTKSQIKNVSNKLIAASLKTVNDNPTIQLSIPPRAAVRRTLNLTKTKKLLKLISSTDRNLNSHDKYWPFCLNDSGNEGSERFIILGDKKKLNALGVHNKIWLCDGTFEICPRKLYQWYAVHIQIGGSTKISFSNRFFEALISLIGDGVPEKLLIDFQQAALSAISSLFETEIKGCYFGLCQSFYPKLSELGLKKPMQTMLS